MILISGRHVSGASPGEVPWYIDKHTRRRYDDYFQANDLTTPCLMIDLDVVARQYHLLAEVLPGVEIYYAVKANPHPEVIRLLVDLGSSFDVASKPELDLCLAAGARPENISFGNTIKRSTDISYAYERGIRQYAIDSEGELNKVFRCAPGSIVYCRILVDGGGAQWPLSRKFGCDPQMAADLLDQAKNLNLRPGGVSFHVGSQQLDPTRWQDAIALTASVFAELKSRAVDLSFVNLGGGFPSRYGPGVPAPRDCGLAIKAALSHCGLQAYRIVAEPGRFLVGDAGLLRSRVILVSRKSSNADRRWVYLDVGRFGGLAETENEAIRYPIATAKDGLGTLGPVNLAGPTCDSQDILYEMSPVYVSSCLREGDYVDFLCAGAYTSSYSSVGFNGFPPLPTFCFGGDLG